MGFFNIDFDILNYKDILPDIDEYLAHDEILYMDEYGKGNIENCYWRRLPEPYIITDEYMNREMMRILRTGVWCCVGEEIVWIPPNYYFFLQYGTAAGVFPQFRLKRLKHVYFKIKIRKNPKAIGTYTIKNRQDGETTMAMSDALWESGDGLMDFGAIGVQSKTRDTVTQSCWRSITMQWNLLPVWLRDKIYSDFVSGDKIAEKMKFIRQKTDNDAGRDILLLYGPSVHNAFDSINNMRRCILDEINKWKECHFYATFINYKKFIAPGTSRKGLFDIFSSPADENGWWNDEAFSFWKESDPTDLIDGTTKSGVFRYYSNPLDGIEGFYNKYGDVDDVNQIYDWIMKERKKVKKEFEMSEIRAYPLNETEMFESTDGSGTWSNAEGIKKRIIYLTNRRFKDSVVKEPVKIFGNLEREDGYIDGDVVFRPADVHEFDLQVARFCFSYRPQNKEPLKDIFRPPSYIENSLGVDPFARRHPKGKKRSNGAMVNWKFRDLLGTGIMRCPTMIYSCRPQHEATFYEDVIKAAIFNRARIQYENITAGLGEYVEDRGYHRWLLPSKGEKEGSKLTGDSPTGKGGFLDEGIGLLDAALNTPLMDDEQYLLELQWFIELLEDNLKFNPLDTHEADLTMAEIQALIGAVKMMMLGKKKPSNLNGEVIGYLLG